MLTAHLAAVIGEHGDSKVLTRSLATVSGMKLNEFAPLRKLDCLDEVLGTLTAGCALQLIRLLQEKFIRR